jgi:hypothetical protein
VLRLASLNRLLTRHRRAAAIVGVLVVCGVAALNVHAALPEHHGGDGDATVCVAALAVAVIAALGWRAAGEATARDRIVCAPKAPVPISHATAPPLPRARAGPLAVVVLRR